MFQVVYRGLLRDLARVVSQDVITPADFDAICDAVGEPARRARKVGFVAARQAEQTEHIETLWEGDETSNTANPGDWIVTNMSSPDIVMKDGSGNVNTYVISADKFPTLYEPTDRSNEYGLIHTSKGVVDSVFLPGGFDIAAPWGAQQTARHGYLLRNGTDVYGNQTETFRATYEIID